MQPYMYSFPSPYVKIWKVKKLFRMGFKEKMAEWIAKHPQATLEEAFEAGWFACSEAWCHGKREKLEECITLMREIID